MSSLGCGDGGGCAETACLVLCPLCGSYFAMTSVMGARGWGGRKMTR